MRAYGVRIPVVVTAMAAMLLLLFGGQFLYNQQAIAQPLVAITRTVPAVQHVQLQNTPGGLTVQVRLGLVDNLRETYLAVENQVAGVLGSQHFNLALVDTRDQELVDDYYQLNDILQQGMATGQFVAMKQNAEAAGRKLGLDRVDVIVDDRFVYVELVKGSHYLYQLLPRQPVLPVTSNGGGA
jgi:hypothetical protein